ncbi:MAG: hypothetical protein B7X59_00545 [Polaromonas sp. 39-63-203]|uniref:hypothetical protein n=1 Tax=Polaromonas sp. TaxID=1869339 RepID=UPI000BD9B074|nr:hypothetical protein [Polaromonas sp.]OYY53720.1 MAG: hypothetical protein B7Y54_01880 [Polaromonas sp. 35-63-240]OYZ03427.1 MAG: hypothetical protein B7Y42_00730 [Polaromonas sp. 28-63-22]OYZ85268.1 MAG: hypothetical protein B7Y03_00280 [Polaromonas sp. 24-62-144]OZB02430.1 MAG: hypothetical protein B7X59_00545 [Polaromonas sp. 39-63-203]HQS31399.1 hypothetical protein [Polaromonas sp.]
MFIATAAPSLAVAVARIVRLIRAVGLIAVCLLAAGPAVFADGMPSARPAQPEGRVLIGFDGLRFGMNRTQIQQDLLRRDVLQFERVRVLAGDEIRYRTFIGDLPFDVFLQFETDGRWLRATVQLAGSTFGLTPQHCGELHERVLYLVSLQHGRPDQRVGPPAGQLPRTFTQRADFRFLNAATVTVQNRFDAETCYNVVFYDASPRRPIPSTF